MAYRRTTSILSSLVVCLCMAACATAGVPSAVQAPSEAAGMVAKVDSSPPAAPPAEMVLPAAPEPTTPVVPEPAPNTETPAIPGPAPKTEALAVPETAPITEAPAIPEIAPQAEAPAVQEPAPEAEAPTAAKPHGKPAARDELTVTFTAGQLELNPIKSFKADEAQIFTALYEGLFSYHPLSMEPVAALASKWETSEDKKTWTFHIRDNARYWNGDRVTAAHFRLAWLSMIDPANDAPYSSLFDLIAGAKDYRLGRVKDASAVGIKAVDANTLVVNLAAPASFFPNVLCHHSFSPMHPKMAKIADWNAQVPISNGPFYIIERDETKIVLAKNELYWDAKNVALKRLTLLFPADGSEAAALWDSGGAQWLSGDIDLDTLQDVSGITLNAMFATHYYYFRCADAPWTDSRVRRALAVALPWDEIRQDYNLPASTLIYPIPNYPELDGLTAQNLDEARKLLAEAGFANGVGLPEVVVRITPAEDAGRVGGIMKAVWEAELGIRVRLDTVDFEGYYDSLKLSDYQLGSTTWIGDFADPYTFLQMWSADSNLNDAQYRDKDYESLLEKSMTEEGEERWKTLGAAENLLLSTGVVLPICYSPALNVIDTDEVSGWYPNPLDIHPFKYLGYAVFKALPGVALAR